MTINVSLLDEQHVLVECNTDSLELQLQLKDKVITTIRERLTEKKQTVSVPESYTPWWKNALAFIGGLALLLLGIGALAKKLKP